ncbi:hypothetical protein Pyn_30028 [Prunus yedoensis var. nudiflora]|uniref:Uncharacterized protein n=1 Tax=Prunus yedoensis var. nudiflora TaxID=2094558 RepID=A0A314ZP66_PRUYE|nr:hypothetical protein Pyn_30028 [Prunus yedoensis var. nudiflora]
MERGLRGSARQDGVPSCGTKRRRSNGGRGAVRVCHDLGYGVELSRRHGSHGPRGFSGWCKWRHRT